MRHTVALSNDGEHKVRNLQLLCPYCNRVKGTPGSQGFRMKMTELRAHNAATGVMVDEREADRDELAVGGCIELEQLIGNVGSQNYEIPESVELSAV